MRRMYLFVAVMFAAAAVLSFGCSGDDDKKIGLEANLMDYTEGNIVNFIVNGNAVCKKCQDENIKVDMMHIEAYPKGDPTTRLALGVYEGIGQFQLSEMRALAGTTVEIHGQIYKTGKNSTTNTLFYGYKEVVVPDENDKVIGITLSFPSSDEDSN